MLEVARREASQHEKEAGRLAEEAGRLGRELHKTTAEAARAKDWGEVVRKVKGKGGGR